MAGNLACLAIDARIGEDFLRHSLPLRLGVVFGPQLLAFALVWARVSPRISYPAIVISLLALVSVPAHLSTIAGPIAGDRYLLAAGLVALAANFVLPMSFRYSAFAAAANTALILLFAVDSGELGFIELGAFFAFLILTTLVATYRTELGEKRSFLLGLRDSLRVAELSDANARLAELTRTDQLTDLANRRGFDETYARLLAEAQQANDWIGLLMIDIDRFKQFNDALGHEEGDVCLCTVAGALKEALRESDAFVARYGGEEFAVVLPGAGPVEARRTAESLRKAIEDLKLGHPAPPHRFVTISIGVAAARMEPSMASEAGPPLLNMADRALYDAKRKGRNRTAFATPAAA